MSIEDKDIQLGHGGLDSPEDPRQWVASAIGATVETPKSVSIDFSERQVSMQKQIGCCVGCTFEEIKWLIEFQNTGSTEELSWRFVYAMCKSLEGTSGYENYPRTAGSNDGTYPSLAAEVVRKYGIPLAKYCPNDSSLDPDSFVYNRKLSNIPKEALEDAKKRAGGYHVTFPISIDGIKQAIDYAYKNKGAVAILRSIGNTYWTDKDGVTTWDKNRLLPIRTPAQITGGHEETLYAYETEESTGRVIIKWLNHWSSDWADNGRGWEYADVWLPYIREIRVFVPAIQTNQEFTYTFNTDLKFGMKNSDVVALQHCLKIEGLFPAEQSFTGYFGLITLKAVKDFQQKYAKEILIPAGLTAPTGFVGQRTRAKLNQIYSPKTK